MSYNELSNENHVGLYETRMNEFCVNFLNRPSTQTEIGLNTNLNVSRPKCSVSPINLESNSVYQPIHEPDSLLQSTTHNTTYNISPFINKIIQPQFVQFSNTSQHDSGIYSSYQNSSILTSSPFNVSTKSAFTNTVTNRFLAANDLNIKKSIRFQSTPNKSTQEPFVPKIEVKTESNRVLYSNRVNFHNIHELAVSSSSASDESKFFSYNSDYSSNIEQSDACDGLSFNEKLKKMSQAICNKENSYDLISRTKRKPRTQITKQQKEILEYAYKMKSYPDSAEIEYLCNLLGFEENVIRIWFQNKRARNKIKC